MLLLEDVIDVITPWFHDWGLVIIFVATFLESSVVIASVLPGESVLLLGGFMASPSSLIHTPTPPVALEEVILVAFLGAVLGDIAGYIVGRWSGRAIVRRFGRFFFLPEKRLPVMERYFASYGVRAVVLGRFAPFIRSVRTLVAGTAKMPFLRFLLPDLLAAALWASGIAVAGYLLGESWDIAQRYLGAGGVVVFLLLCVGFVLTWRKVRARVEQRFGAEEADEPVQDAPKNPL